MGSTLSAAQTAFDKVREGDGWDDEEATLGLALLAIGQELAIANGLALAALMDEGAERERLIAMCKRVILNPDGSPR